ncbi:MAG: class II fructose-bisphosphate aldolase [Candidatus Omnitrophica bacterium]|nr:class II fructose-bisphosphate aldolase [Candidatus Omnitrophota bacterium]
MIYQNECELIDGTTLVEKDNKLFCHDKEVLIQKIIPNMVDTIILGDLPFMKKIIFWAAYNLGLNYGVIPSSIHGLYQARGEGKVGGFVVPAINIRTLTYDLARSVFRAAKKINAGAFILEIATSEIGYTAQRPMEYSTMIILAALREEFVGPVFILGDHFQVVASKFVEDRNKELNNLKTFIDEAVDASFYNIDIDASTLVDLSKDTLEEQQRLNYEMTAFFTKYVRSLEPADITISIGGEIGEVGGKNSTAEELTAFMSGYLNQITGIKGISKMSVQTGTTHGGVVLPDGTIAEVKIDLKTLSDLSDILCKCYGMAGAVQHGASTLPNEAFHHFSEVNCAEIHLATQFQNIVYDYLPIPMKEEIYSWINEHCSSERKPNWTDHQFNYKTRKKALGQFKKEIYSLRKDVKNKIASVVEEEFTFLFDKLNIKDTKEIVNNYVTLVKVEKKKEDFFKDYNQLKEGDSAD